MNILIEGGVTRKRLATPPMEKPISWVDITSIQLSGQNQAFSQIRGRVDKGGKETYIQN